MYQCKQIIGKEKAKKSNQKKINKIKSLRKRWIPIKIKFGIFLQGENNTDFASNV